MTFSHIDSDDYRQCLLNTALTCKYFLYAALDALWEELDSLVPLLKLLPALQLERNTYVCAYVHVFYMTLFCFKARVLSGNVSEADWNRLRYYSRKVKSFEFTCEDDPPIHSSTYFRIGQLQSSLFPSLRCLYYDLKETSISHIFLFLLSPLLESLELYNIRGFEHTIVVPFLATLPRRWSVISSFVTERCQWTFKKIDCPLQAAPISRTSRCSFLE